jgi:hypothetical protein
VQLPANPIPHPSIILPIIFHAHHLKQNKEEMAIQNNQSTAKSPLQ